MSYTSKNLIENYLMLNIDSSYNDQIDFWISAAEIFVNKYTGRKDGFDASGVDSIKYYDGNGSKYIIIDNFITLSTIEILEYNGSDVAYTLTEGKGNDFVVVPYNEDSKYKLILEPSAQVGSWLSGNKRIKLTADWGYSSTVPKDIELATTMLVSETILQTQGKGIKVNAESLGDYSISYVNNVTEAGQILSLTKVKQILDRYKILTI